MKQTVLITGASSGIGLATAELFHKQGWNVVATLRSPDKAPERLKRDGIHLVRLDVTDPASIRSGIETAIQTFGALDVVINNAGFGVMGVFEPTSFDRIRRQFETNVFGLMSVIQNVLPHFRERRQGTIVNISSVGGRSTFPLYSLYHSTKFAVEGFTESLQFELEPLGIRLKLVEPGPVHTEFGGRSADITDTSKWPDYESYQATLTKKIKNGAKGGQAPEQVAKVIYRAATDPSRRLRYVSGAMAKSMLIMRKVLPEWANQLFVRLMIRSL